MIAREVDVVAVGIVDARRGPRSGVHLSDILHHIRKKLDKQFAKEVTVEMLHRFKMGEGFEAGVMSRGLAFNLKEHHQCVWKAYTFTLNGVEMTTDAVCLGCSDAPLVWEVKLTWLGMKKGIEVPSGAHALEFRTYFYQLMAYVYALQLEMQKKVRGRFVFGYVHGDYVKDRNPRIKAWDIEFTEKELHDNWRMLMGVRDEMKKAGLIKKGSTCHSTPKLT